MTGKPSWRFLRPAVLVGLPVVAVAVGAALMQSQAPETLLASEQKPVASDSIAVPPPPQTTIRLSPPPSPPAATPRLSLPMPPMPPQVATVDRPTSTADWMALPIDDLRGLAHGGDVRAMEELARRLVSGIGVPEDAQSGAGWLLRAAEAGASGAAFNVGVMYERGFVVERDPARAVEWYQKAADGNVAVAKHNLALLLREGKGAPRDGAKAIELLRSAARQGLSTSMYSLGDMYERGDAVPRDAPAALAWFGVTVEFERQVLQGSETPLAKTAQQKVETLQRTLTPAQLERAAKLGQVEFREIVAALNPSRSDSPPSAPVAPSTGVSAAPPAPPPPPPRQLPPPPPADEAAGWPKTSIEQVRAIQQSLIDLQRLGGKADGVAGPMTRTAIRNFEKAAGMRETGGVSRELYVALRRSLALRDTVARSPLPPPPRVEASAPRPSRTAAAAGVDLGMTEPPPPPPTSADIERTMPSLETPKPDPDAWPEQTSDQIRAIQVLLGELKLMSDAPTGEIGPVTLAAIHDFQRMAGLELTGEPSKELFESLKEMRARTMAKPATAPN